LLVMVDTFEGFEPPRIKMGNWPLRIRKRRGKHLIMVVDIK
jgi:hypothetical protein